MSCFLSHIRSPPLLICFSCAVVWASQRCFSLESVFFPPIPPRLSHHFIFLSPPRSLGARSQCGINYPRHTDARKPCCVTTNTKASWELTVRKKKGGFLLHLQGNIFGPHRSLQRNGMKKYLCRLCCKHPSSAPCRCRTPSRRRCRGLWGKRDCCPCRCSSASSVSWPETDEQTRVGFKDVSYQAFHLTWKVRMTSAIKK